MQDVLTALKKEYDSFRSLLLEAEQSTAAEERAEVFLQVRELFETHAELLSEEVFTRLSPLEGGAELIDELKEEQSDLLDAFRELDEIEEEEDLEDGMIDLSKSIEKHLRKQELHLLPKLKKSATAAELRDSSSPPPQQAA